MSVKYMHCFSRFSSFCYIGRVDESESLMYYSDSQSYGLLNDENFEPAFDITPTPEQTVDTPLYSILTTI